MRILKISGRMYCHFPVANFVTVTKSAPKKTALTSSILNNDVANGDFKIVSWGSFRVIKIPVAPPPPSAGASNTTYI